MAGSFPERIYVSDREAKHFKNWLNGLRLKKPVILELGIGTGDFLLNQARCNPDYFFLGVEVKKDRIYKAFKKTQDEGVENICFLQTTVQKLLEYKIPKVERIYLFFPDPWPKDRHYKRRMVHNDFLAIYKQILKSSGEFIFKTDHENLFEYAKKSFPESGWKLIDVKGEYNSPLAEQTAYEKKFLAAGKSICFLKANTTSL